MSGTSNTDYSVVVLILCMIGWGLVCGVLLDQEGTFSQVVGAAMLAGGIFGSVRAFFRITSGRV